MYHCAISAFGTYHHHKASNYHIITKLVCHFYYRTLPHINSLIHGMSIVILFVTAKYCPYITLLCFDMQYFFLQYHAVVFILASGGKMYLPGHLLLHTCIESHSSVNLCPVFYLQACLCCTEPLRKKLYGLHETSLFSGLNSQHMPVYAKMISSWVWKTLSIAMTHISGHSLGCCSIFSFDAWSFLGVHTAGR